MLHQNYSVNTVTSVRAFFFFPELDYTGHVVSCLGWSTHSLAPLSFRGATYSGVFTLVPLLTGLDQAHHGVILREAAALADGGKLRPLLNKQRFSSADIDAAHTLVEFRALGKVVVDL